MGGAVFIVFLVLKLTGHITWSWWWVTCPLWAGLAVVLAVVGAVLVIASVAAVAEVPGRLVQRTRKRHYK